MYDPTEYDKDAANELAYDNAIDDILTGDIHLVPDTFLFTQIAKRVSQWKRWALAEINIHELQERWSMNLFKDINDFTF